MTTHALWRAQLRRAVSFLAPYRGAVRGRTTFIVAHRLATVVGADRILVLRHGVIAEEGTHTMLVRQNGYYAGLVARQTRGLVRVA